MQSAPTQTTDQGPHHLAQTVLRALSVTTLDLPEEWLLGFFFDVLYQASFRLENGRPLVGRVAWQSPVNRPDSEKSSHLLLSQPVPLNVGSLALLMAGVDTQSSALLVCGGDTQPLVIEGIVRCSEPLFQSCFFSAEILGPAHLKVDVGLDYPLELRRNRLHLSTQNVFGRGPVRRRLSALLQDIFSSIQALLPGEIASSPLLTAGSFPLSGGSVLINEQDWPETLEQFWINALVQLLQQVFETRQGGSVLLTRRSDTLGRKEDWQPLPHEATFVQLRHLLEKRAVQAIAQQVQSVQSLTERSALLKDIPLDDMTLQEPVLRIDPLGNDPEIAQAIRFLASLSRVDGLLRLDPHLDLISFGGHPNTGRLPDRVYLAGNEMAEESELSPISYRSFGPRNQALLRQCYQDPDAIGFAFTQDGDVRAMLWHEEKLVIWSNVQLPRR
ncbi:MAG: putative sensor domain DACNV-containing protein [Janthinobacterium lividum]